MQFRYKTAPPAKKSIWRNAEDAPWSDWADSISAAVPTTRAHQPDVPSETWVSSSFDLLFGVDVSEVPDTVPSELLDEVGPVRDGVSTATRE
jgi:hypothetical protein